MVQAAEAVSTLLAPAIAGVLYVGVGLHALIGIDLLTFLFAIFTLSVVRFPHPERTVEASEHGGLRGFLHDAGFGWRYLRERPGLLGLLIVFALCNFVASLAWPLMAPMILDQTTPDVYGYLGSVMGVGMVLGTLAMSTWGGLKRRIVGVAVGDILGGLLMALMGLRNWLPLIAAGGLGGMFFMPITNGHSQALWQSKVAADVQGRVFAIRRMIAFSIIPVANLLAGPLADRVFTPALLPGGALASTFAGQVLGVGPGRGIGLMFVLAGVVYALLSSVSLIHPRIRRVELELPDALAAQPAGDETGALPEIESVPA
jgi:hypothetical protein